MRKAKKKPRGSFAKPAKVASKPREAALDTLRGIAIVLMIVDHAADMLWHLAIEPNNLRMLTRLSMPLFCVLVGYFLSGKAKLNPGRMLQIAGAAVLANLIYWPLNGRLEILVSLLLCIGIYPFLKSRFVFLVIAVGFVSVDPTRFVLDYPLSACVAMVALGVIGKTYSMGVALLVSLLFPIASLLDASTTRYVLWCAPPAVGLLMLAVHKRLPAVAGLSNLGKYPLSAYVLQYYVLWIVAWILRR